MGKFEGNSLVGKIVILSRELNQIWGSAVYLNLVFLSNTGAKTSRFEKGKVSIKICVEHICVSIYRVNKLNRGIFFLIFRKFKIVSIIWESLKEILSLEKSYSIKVTQSNLGFCSLFGLSIPVEYGC